MINKTSLFIAAALITGSAFAASADPMTNDVNTGLPITIYNAPLAQLQQEGLPLSPAAQAYLRDHQHVAARRSAKAPRAVVNESASYQSGVVFDDKQSGHY